MRFGANRLALVAALRKGIREVSFQLEHCDDAEFTVLCKAMAVLGPAVRRVVNESPILRQNMLDHIRGFAAALASCRSLVDLR